MEYIGETGRQLKIRMKEHETDSKVDFRKKSGKKKKDKLSGLSEHLKKKKHQLDWSSIKILAKENNYWKHPEFNKENPITCSENHVNLYDFHIISYLE